MSHKSDFDDLRFKVDSLNSYYSKSFDDCVLSSEKVAWDSDVKALKDRVAEINADMAVCGYISNKLIVSPSRDFMGNDAFMLKITGNNDDVYYHGLGSAQFPLFDSPKSPRDSLRCVDDMFRKGGIMKAFDSASYLGTFNDKCRRSRK